MDQDVYRQTQTRGEAGNDRRSRILMSVALALALLMRNDKPYNGTNSGELFWQIGNRPAV